MAAIQSQFDTFHATIKHDEGDERAKLREKREILIADLKSHLPEETPVFTSFNQGSYAMNTGIVPLDGNYDIDVGLIFDRDCDDYSDPVELKKNVSDALTRINRTVEIRRPCVTVTYLKDGDPEYHVDLAIYAKRVDGSLAVAKGKENSEKGNRVWEDSDPQGLTTEINNRFNGDDAAQFRRCIRYMKRWRDRKFSNGGAPLSIALTVAAYYWFQPSKDFSSGKYVDLFALKNWVNAILNNFTTEFYDSAHTSRLKVKLPVTPNSDLMEKMTNNQMTTFQERLTALRDELTAAEKDDLPEDACARLRKQFGDDFPVPEKAETARFVAAPYISTGTSA